MNVNAIKSKETLAIDLPKIKGYVAVWFDEKGNTHVIPNSERKRRKNAEMIALIYQLEHQVKVDVFECMY